MARHSTVHHGHYVSPHALPEVRKVGVERPFQWLADGWQDLVSSSGVSLGYGFVVTLIMTAVMALLQSINAFHFAVGVMAGFAFIGPIFAVGLYEVSRRKENGEFTELPGTWSAWRRNGSSIFGIGVVLMLLLLAWFMTSMQMTAVMLGASTELTTVFGGAETLTEFALSIQWPMVAAFAATGVVFAIVTFILSAFSVPMVYEHEDLDAISAMVTSYRAVKKNPGTMAVWAVLIGVITGLAAIPLFLGLIVAFPLLAFATWHAYRDTVAE